MAAGARRAAWASRPLRGPGACPPCTTHHQAEQRHTITRDAQQNCTARGRALSPGAHSRWGGRRLRRAGGGGLVGWPLRRRHARWGAPLALGPCKGEVGVVVWSWAQRPFGGRGGRRRGSLLCAHRDVAGQEGAGPRGCCWEAGCCTTERQAAAPAQRQGTVRPGVVMRPLQAGAHQRISDPYVPHAPVAEARRSRQGRSCRVRGAPAHTQAARMHTVLAACALAGCMRTLARWTHRRRRRRCRLLVQHRQVLDLIGCTTAPLKGEHTLSDKRALCGGVHAPAAGARAPTPLKRMSS